MRKPRQYNLTFEVEYAETMTPQALHGFKLLARMILKRYHMEQQAAIEKLAGEENQTTATIDQAEI